MKDCPQCHRPVDGITCPWCNAIRVDAHQCSNTERGYRCASLAPYSSATNGDGPWYCYDHFPPFKAMLSTNREAPSASFREIADKLQRRADLSAKPIGDIIDLDAHIEALSIEQESRTPQEHAQQQAIDERRLKLIRP